MARRRRKSMGEDILTALIKAGARAVKSSYEQAERETILNKIQKEYNDAVKSPINNNTMNVVEKQEIAPLIEEKTENTIIKIYIPNSDVTKNESSMLELNISHKNITYNIDSELVFKEGQVYKCEVKHKLSFQKVILEENNFFVFFEKIKSAAKRLDKQYEYDQAIKYPKIGDIYETNRVLGILNSDISNILNNEYFESNLIDFDGLVPFKEFNEPSIPDLLEYPNKPDERSFDPVYTFWDKVLPSKFSVRKREDSQNRFNVAMQVWEAECKRISEVNQDKLREFEEAADKKKKHNEHIETFKKEARKFKSLYINCLRNSVLGYYDIILSRMRYSEIFPFNYALDYSPDGKMLSVEFELPNFDNFPSLQEVRYIKVKREVRESFLTETKKEKLYEETIYKIAVKILHRLASTDYTKAIHAISFNGMVDHINKATGKRQISCILSVVAKTEDIRQIDVRNVDPKVCFKSFKGVSSVKISTLTAISPVIPFNREDKRFIDHYAVSDQIDDSVNLAEISWEDFEHLIRELFEKEFSSNGSEVRVTQSSRDGGVDVIAFDPDPIKGGKIIIQAKRYNNVVGVAAVRDLYGTILNEGANRGILVTTANYGAAAYEFAKNKPITLLSGSNLLHLLEKHGHKAKIITNASK